MDALGRPLTILVDCDEVLPGQLWLGSAICPLRFPERLAMNHITHILNLTAPYPDEVIAKLSPSLTVRVVPVEDSAKFPIGKALAEARGFIKQTLETKDARLLVHCEMGASRSPCIVAGYLMHENRWTLQEALDYLALRRLQTEPNEGFIAVLRREEAEIFDVAHDATSLATDELYSAWLARKRAASKLLREQRAQAARANKDACKTTVTVQRKIALRELDTHAAFNMLQLFGPKVVDVRSGCAFAKRHLLEAVSIPLASEAFDENEEAKATGIKQEQCKKVMFAQTILVCGDSKGDALRAAKQLSACFMGIKKAKVTLLAVLTIPTDAFLQRYPFLGGATSTNSREVAASVESKKEDKDDAEAGKSKPNNTKLPPRLRARMEQRKQKISRKQKTSVQSKCPEKRLRCPSEIIPAALYQGHKTHAGNASIMYHLGITHVVNVSCKVPCHFESSYDVDGTSLLQNLKYLRLELRDVPTEDATAALEEGPAFIQDAIKQGGCVFVHCQEGKSRSTAVVLAYLMRSPTYSFSLAKAFDYVLTRRPDILPNRGYIEQLGKLELTLHPGTPSTFAEVPAKHIRG